uniref:Putative endocytosis/signaling protein ehd1 n=1 Tax=Amblyomma aureolatum TaxID=187763 RepID=A0A1E1XAZ3_9ACAR
MSSRAKQRNATNSAESATLSVNERILRDCHALYVDPDNGLVKIAESLGQTLLPPRKKIVVLLIGNHSAGKSTFINWYIEEHVQKTGVAIETQGFALVTSGKKRESLTGNATLHLYPHFKPLQKVKGVVDYLTTEISTSRQKRFSLVTFIDTPGLVDGDMKYPYDVNKTILWLGQMADLIFVFFDPIGQALCKRTLNIVEELNDKYVDKMRFYLSKADEAGHEADRQKVMMQIVQELCKRPGLNRCGFDMPAIYIPDASKQAVRCVNQIEEVCKDIEKTINQTVQNALNSLEHDCEQLSNEVLLRISQDNQARSENLSTGGRGVCLGLFGLALPSLLLLNLALRSAPQEVLHTYLGPATADFLFLFTLPLQVVSGLLPDPFRLGVAVALFAVSIFILLVAKWQSRLKPILTRQQKRTLLDAQSYLTNFVKPKKQRLYEEYLRQSVADYDL